MSQIDPSSDVHLHDLFSKCYDLLKYKSQVFGYFPWPYKEDFVNEWVFAFKNQGPVRFLRLTVQMAMNERLMTETFDAFLKISSNSCYPRSINEHLRYMIHEIQANSLNQSGQSIQDDLSMSSSSGKTLSHLNSRELDESSRQQTFTPQGNVSGSLDRSTVDEMIYSLGDVLDGQIDNEQSSSIVSFSTDSHPVAVEADAMSFGISYPESFSSEAQALPDQPRNPLSYLTRVSRKKKIGHPKKEYFRCQHIRALKKSIRQIQTNKIPGTSIHKVSKSNPSHLSKWSALREFYRLNKAILNEICDTAIGPTTDGKKKREAVQTKDPKSYNNEYCRIFFSNQAVKRYNELFADLVYDCLPDEMCKKMKAQCCSEFMHSDSCIAIWNSVHEYARMGMLQELGVEVEGAMEEPELKADDYLSVNRQS